MYSTVCPYIRLVPDGTSKKKREKTGQENVSEVKKSFSLFAQGFFIPNFFFSKKPCYEFFYVGTAKKEFHFFRKCKVLLILENQIGDLVLGRLTWRLIQ